ncbi:hypothetical protein GCM10011507_34390 [Edaphobacter acidisoli]|uniref:Uncharacterized protein n=1 Tax=Edaphobacter acidisoli TaxID=2040573 RepID=A0A916S1I9_9BACT|nr:hypothetical protein [Edaphobacter acidisoli]GGA80269.1 hypothetical protein GCM10011507_34390 [Edaphobacter acidisoli]
MSKLKIGRGASKVRRAPLKATINGTVADDLALMCEWSENDLSYLVNLLLEFAIAQSEDFQKHKVESVAMLSKDTNLVTKPARRSLPQANDISLRSEKEAAE